MFKDYYAILDISFPSSPEEIKAAYRKQSLKWHPDRNPGQNTEEHMKDINEAYSVLREPALKQRYDKEYVVFKQRQESSTRSQTYHSSQSDQKETKNEEPGTQHRYRQYEYDYDINDQDLKEDIKKARKEAEEFVRQFMRDLKKDTKTAAAGAWEGAMPYIIGGAIMSLIILAVQTCS